MIPPAGREGEQKLATMFLNGIPQAQNAYGTIVLDPMDNLEAAGQRGGAGMDRFRQIGQRDVRFQMRVEVLHRACDAPP